MDRYRDFSLGEFVWDKPFRNWVLNPTREDDETWQNWLAAHPDKREIVERARQLVLSIRPANASLSNPEKRKAVERIVERLETRHLDQTEASRLPWYNGRAVRIAAMLVLLAGLGWMFWLRHQPEQIGYDQLVAAANAEMVEAVNTTAKPLTISLEDGSRITLDPGSRMSYPAHFSSSQREVFLSGKAFFDIAKNPSKPFFVYANELVTKVLGTSFTVRSFADEQEVSVAVKSGKVAVFSRDEPGAAAKQSSRDLTGVVIEPNQQVVFLRKSVKITKSIVPEPEVVAEAGTAPHLEFDEAPLSAVFSALQSAYGIDIIYDKNIMDECPITATLTEMSLYEQLDLVCKAVNASYKSIDGRIVVEGKGCRNN
ncbi:MAG: iron dicitrate transport regulator FecR [Dyadobacter sp. 50-39]|uniref:FecR family protein n=1 Tax=Dyadobacter sp. 50-39 TaxID=1895756 RepID=UPI0009648CCA|nr:FecR family protein [Dyadobacter sp. 50-39]OJV18040.1 MAG: iron dicitrate transport regulator FecR [Dyadobacter sp. 50-39]